MDVHDLQSRTGASRPLLQTPPTSIDGLFAELLGAIAVEAWQPRQEGSVAKDFGPPERGAADRDRLADTNQERPERSSDDWEVAEARAPERPERQDRQAAPSRPTDQNREDDPTPPEASGPPAVETTDQTDDPAGPESTAAADATIPAAPGDGGEAAVPEIVAATPPAVEPPSPAALASEAGAAPLVIPGLEKAAKTPAEQAAPIALARSHPNSALQRDTAAVPPPTGASVPTVPDPASAATPSTSQGTPGTAGSAAPPAIQVASQQATVAAAPNSLLQGADSLSKLQNAGDAPEADGPGNPLLLGAKPGGSETGFQQGTPRDGAQQQLLQQAMIGARLQNGAPPPQTAARGFSSLVPAGGAMTGGAAVGGEATGATTPSGQALPSAAGQPRGLIQAAAQTAASQSGGSAQGAPAQQVALQISKSARAGQDRLTMQLHPAELGRIEIKMEFAENGHLRAVVSAEKNDTLDLLQRDARALERALQDAGVKTDSNSLSFQRGDQRQAEGRGAGGQPASARPADEPGDLAEDDTAHPRQSSHDGSLDIEV